MRFAFLLVPILSVAARITLFDEQQSVKTVPTFDFFEHRSDPYNVTGLACYISMMKDPETKQCKVVAPPVLEPSNFTRSFEQTIMYALFQEAHDCGIETITQLFDKAHDMLPLLERTGYPPSKTLVIFTNAIYDGEPGCPLKEPYISKKFTVSDAPPSRSVNVALVSRQDGLKFFERFDDEKLYAFTVVQETDAWNAIFLSYSYIFFNWGSIALYFITIIIALKPTLAAYGKSAKGAAPRHDMIFWLAISVALSNFFHNNL